MAKAEVTVHVDAARALAAIEEALTLVHHPDEGCYGCAVFHDDGRNETWCAADADVEPTWFDPAPSGCPLRRGLVVVAAHEVNDRG